MDLIVKIWTRDIVVCNQILKTECFKTFIYDRNDRNPIPVVVHVLPTNELIINMKLEYLLLLL